VQLTASKLAPLSGSLYEVWVVEGPDKHSAGTFNVGANGELEDDGQPASFRSVVEPATADALVVTIEPVPDPDPAPSGIVVLMGEPGEQVARLSFPVDLSSVAGSLVLATPTDSDASNEAAGIWFLDPAGPGPSLRLPELPVGWIWEGWGVTHGVPLTTGRFSSASEADLSAPFSGPVAAPPFPGEDFLENLPAGVTSPVNLADGSSMAVISIEPDLEGVDPTGEDPFAVKPLKGAIPAGVADHQPVVLTLDLSEVPSGVARF
jgi:hypothetical protein